MKRVDIIDKDGKIVTYEIDEYILDLFEKFVFFTNDGKDIRLKQGRYNENIFSFGDNFIFTFPHYIESNSRIKSRNPKLRWIDVSNLRDREISKSNKTVELIKKIAEDEYRFRFEKEIPILIDRKKWLDVCKLNNLTEESIKNCTDPRLLEVVYKFGKDVLTTHLNKTHIRLDLYDPVYGLDIEHDGSKYHIENDIRDIIRDEYLHLTYPNIRVKRIRDFKKSKIIELRVKCDDILEKGKLDNPEIINYNKYIYNSCLSDYIYELNLITLKMNAGWSLSQLSFINRGYDKDTLEGIRYLSREFLRLKSL